MEGRIEEEIWPLARIPTLVFITLSCHWMVLVPATIENRFLKELLAFLGFLDICMTKTVLASVGDAVHSITRSVSTPIVFLEPPVDKIKPDAEKTKIN